MTHHASLRRGAADLIGGEWAAIPGDRIASRNPAHPERIIWSGSPQISHVDDAVAAARAALPAWSRWPRERRFAVLRRLRAIYERDAQRLADLICDEVGKVMWDALSEARALAAKIDITLDESPSGPLRRVTDSELSLGDGRAGRCWFRPHGVMAVLAPFNFPAHLANGHIVPALAMGNTIVLKPSERTPAVGQLLAEVLQEALDAEGAPPGVVNLVQGSAEVAAPLTRHTGVDGILFTGSFPVGRRILEANLDTPGRIVALEMGGNNAAVVMPDADLRQAAIECVRSAFVTTGQRCTCTRRLIVHRDAAPRLIPAIQKAASNLIVGDPRAEHPVFMGPMISDQARRSVLAFQSQAGSSGRVLLESTATDAPGWSITPGIIEVDGFGTGRTDAGRDEEVFGPLLRVTTVGTLDDAIEQANATQYGLAASIFTRDPRAIEQFLHEARAGCVNVNTGTAGASSKLPFGGLGRSGNHRPAGSFSLDYCAYPIAGMIESGHAATLHPGMRFEDSWIR